LTIRTTAGDKLSIAESQLLLAELSLEEGRSPVEQEAVIRQTPEVFPQQKDRDEETLAWGLMARALLEQGKEAAAKEAMRRARSLAAKSQSPETRWRTAVAAARVETAEKDIGHSAAGSATCKKLAAIIAKSRELGYKRSELEARLALAEIEMKGGTNRDGTCAPDRNRGRCQGQKLQHLIARRAASARS